MGKGTDRLPVGWSVPAPLETRAFRTTFPAPSPASLPEDAPGASTSQPRPVTRSFQCPAQRHASEPVFESDRYRAAILNHCRSAVGRSDPNAIYELPTASVWSILARDSVVLEQTMTTTRQTAGQAAGLTPSLADALASALDQPTSKSRAQRHLLV